MWVDPVAIAKLFDCPHFPHQSKFCTEGLLSRHDLDMLGRTLHVQSCSINVVRVTSHSKPCLLPLYPRQGGNVQEGN